MSAYEKARKIWNDPRVQSIVKEGLREAKREGSAFCQTQFIRGSKGRRGKVGAIVLIDALGLIPRNNEPGCLRNPDTDVIQHLVHNFESVLPVCTHHCSDGPTMCKTDYPVDMSKCGPGDEITFREGTTGDGAFYSLIDMLKGNKSQPIVVQQDSEQI
jgi:hypothetical protein